MSQQVREISSKYADKVHRENTLEQQLLDLTAERDILQKVWSLVELVVYL